MASNKSFHGDDAADINALSKTIMKIAKAAGDAILEIYNSDEGFDVEMKSDASPVTRADLAADKVIVESLRRCYPDVPILTEESSMADYAQRKTWQRYWLIDPLDGTKEFIRRNDQFTVNIALVEGGQAILGVVYVPVSGVMYVGGRGIGAHKIADDVSKPIQGRDVRAQVAGGGIDVVASTHHSNEATDTLVAIAESALGRIRRKSIGSSLKFCLLAEGEADIYPRMAPTSEWDTAAAQAILEAAGGAVYRGDFLSLDYNQKANILNPYFIAVADATYNWSVLFEGFARDNMPQ